MINGALNVIHTTGKLGDRERHLTTSFCLHDVIIMKLYVLNIWHQGATVFVLQDVIFAVISLAPRPPGKCLEK